MKSKGLVNRWGRMFLNCMRLFNNVDSPRRKRTNHMLLLSSIPTLSLLWTILKVRGFKDYWPLYNSFPIPQTALQYNYSTSHQQIEYQTARSKLLFWYWDEMPWIYKCRGYSSYIWQHLRRLHNMRPTKTHFWKWSNGIEKVEMDARRQTFKMIRDCVICSWQKNRFNFSIGKCDLDLSKQKKW